MQKFTTKIVNMMKAEKLYETQGGPIILSQIENEYGPMEYELGAPGRAYTEWAAKMAVDLGTGVPWVMCKQDDAPDPIGHIWRTGFERNELEAVVFEDVLDALEKWHALGIKVYIYSSGSRLAQRLLFGNTNYGDLRKYLCGFFDTTVGNKKETKSYIEITESLGVDNPSAILFVIDVYQEATVAKAAGLEVIISVRPRNGPLPENHGFQTIKSFSEI